MTNYIAYVYTKAKGIETLQNEKEEKEETY
jgi:hypothetical protein